MTRHELRIAEPAEWLMPYRQRVTDWSADAVVVRGGVMADPAAVLEAIEDAVEEGDGIVLSVFVAEPAAHGGRSAAVRHACEDGDIPHGQVRVAPFAAIAADGRTVELDVSNGQAACHHHVVFPAVPTIFEIEKFLDLFDEPIRNPTRESRS